MYLSRSARAFSSDTANAGLVFTELRKSLRLMDSREVGEQMLQDVRRRGVEAYLVHSVSGAEAADIDVGPFDGAQDKD